ncbi:MAG TPA: uracil-DNA glycosylase [Acidobacteriota bacterium]|nr:uracil-DNA glycosylase [Acidobacteriota bacterium]
MKEQKKLGRDILGHLELYKELGVRWVSLPVVATRVKGRAITPASGRAGNPPQPAGNAAVPQPGRGGGGQAPAKVFFDNRSMFDELPTAREKLETIRADLGDCRRCKLAPLRTNIVFGSGNPHAELMFVGEAPGADEDAQGLPFVGRAGQLLTKIIEAIQMRREDVYICNILKCRPPGNRPPENDEIASCEPFLFRQIASVKPKVICALGTFGAQTLLRTREPISRLRGQFIEYRGAKLMATFHPAYLLRNPNEKRKVWEDVQKIRDYLRSLRDPT